MQRSPLGYTVFSGGQVAGRIKLGDAKLKLRDAAGRTVWTIKKKDYGFAVKGPDGSKLYKVKRGDAGAWKLKRADGETLYKFKPSDGGYKVKHGVTKLAKAVRNGDSVELRSSGTTRRVEGAGTPARAMWFALPETEFDCAKRAALAVAFSRFAE